MPTSARRHFGLTSGLTVVLLACGGAGEPQTSTVEAPPSAEAKAVVLSPADLAQGRLRKASADGDFVMVKALLDQGVDVNGVDPTDPQRNSALHAAVDPGHFPVAKLLFQRGADVAAKNALGQTPLDLARSKNHEAIVVLLGMRKAGEAALPEVAAAPIDPSRLDPGALIAKVGDILHDAQRARAPAQAQPEQSRAVPAAAAPVVAAPVVAAPVAAAPITAAPAAAAPPAGAEPADQAAIPPELQQKKDELCGEISAAMGQLTETEALAALEEAGISRDVALQQLAVMRSACP